MVNRKYISSLQNPSVKEVLRLKEKARERKKTGNFVVEGRRELDLAIKGGYEIVSIMVCAEINQEIELPNISAPITVLSLEVYEKLAHRGSTEGILAMAKMKPHGLDSLKLTEQPLILIAEATEKPGNIGALLRTADAANLDAVIIADPKGDIYNPNCIRSSVGCVFTVPIGIASTAETIAFLKERNITIFTASLEASELYAECDFTLPSAIAVGTEAADLSALLLNKGDRNIIIPMKGQIDSMNVSVSAAILIFEAKRQRGF